MKQKVISLFLLLISATLIAQVSSYEYFQGYSEEISGKRFGYHSPLPEVNESLLLRGQDDYNAIEWYSEIVPSNYSNEFATFIWPFGMDVSSTPVDFELSINGVHYVSFSSSRTSDLGPKIIDGAKGSQLILNVTMLDKYEDQMGFAILKIPTTVINKGKPSHFKISTKTNNNNAWFMTFKSSVEKKIDIYQNKVVAKKDGKLFHSLSIDFVHLGEDALAKINIGENNAELLLTAGYNKVEIYVPKVMDTTEIVASIQIANELFSIPAVLTPIREWEIYLVQHTHTDIGYTRPQTEILPEHLRYIDNALDFCDQTDNYPDDAKFRWTCETSWSVREYLNSRPKKQVDRLLKRIQEGRIEATGMFLNFSEIIDESALAAQTKTLRMLKNKGIDVTTAMQNDINGIAWCMVDYYHNTDVKYLTMGIHAHRARKPFNKPTSFWWQSPSGNRLLAYRSEHYQHGNSLSLTTGQQDVLRNNLSKYLSSLEEREYPYDKISLQFSGYITDNSPPSTKACDIIKEWNEKYEWPKLKSALARDFMIYLDEYHNDDIPVQEVAWPDWWTDGVGSAANETKIVRNTQTKMTAITGSMAMAVALGIDMPSDLNSEVEEVYDNLLFYDEHTHGAAESVSDPLAQNTVNQWGMKASYAWEAAKKSHALEEKVLAFIEEDLNTCDQPTIAVFNTLNWERAGMIELFLLHEIIPEGVNFTITDVNDKEIPYQRYERRQEGSYYGLWVEDIPPMGYKTLKINAGKKSNIEDPQISELLENQNYKIDIDTKKGVIASIFDKDLNIELIDQNDTLRLGQLVYEQLDNRHELERLTSGTRDTIYKPLGMTRSTLKNIKTISHASGAIYNSIVLNGEIPICADSRGVTIEIRLYHYQKKIELLYSMHKLPIVDPEGVYVSFPFKLNNGILAFEAQGGIVYPGKNQLGGSSSDWNTIQNFASVRNNNSQVVFVSDEIPLVQFGDINTGRYYYRLEPKTNHIFSWVLNNYWVTNFKASQQGELRWTYSLTSANDNTDMFATKFSWGERVPILSRVKLPTVGAIDTKLVSKSIIDLRVPNLLLVNSTISIEDNGVILHIREVEGDHAILDIRRIIEETGAISAQEVNILEEEISRLTSPLLIEHFETKFIRLVFDK